MAVSKFIMHGGLHKTGTTSIQGYLKKHQDQLRQLGISYPLGGEFSDNDFSHYKLALNFQPAIDLLSPEISKVIVSSEEILPQIASSDSSKEQFKIMTSTIHTKFDEFYFVLTLPRTASSLLKRIIIQELRSHVGCSKYYLVNRLETYIKKILASFNFIQEIGIQPLMIKPLEDPLTQEIDILVPFFLETLNLDIRTEEFFTPPDRTQRENTTDNLSFAKDILYAFVRQTTVECKYSPDQWWSTKVQKESAFVFQDFKLLGDKFKSRFNGILELLITSVLNDQRIITLCHTLDTKLLGF
jgi:hypothetical protein